LQSFSVLLVKLLWPHNCWDITSLKTVFLNYVFGNALIFGVSDVFVDEFISIHKSKIKKAKKLRDLIRVYQDIKEEARAIGNEYYERANYEGAWKYGVLSRIIGFMLSDFGHCLALPTGTFKWLAFSSIYL
jgi:hypothetical protein